MRETCWAITRFGWLLEARWILPFTNTSLTHPSECWFLGGVKVHRSLGICIWYARLSHHKWTSLIVQRHEINRTSSVFSNISISFIFLRQHLEISGLRDCSMYTPCYYLSIFFMVWPSWLSVDELLLSIGHCEYWTKRAHRGLLRSNTKIPPPLG